MKSFAALADPTRRRIVELLAQRDLSAGEVAVQFDCTGPAISHHLKVLREAGLVRQSVHAQQRIYTLDLAGLDSIGAWVEEQRHFWNQRLDRLSAQIQADVAAEPPRMTPETHRKRRKS